MVTTAIDPEKTVSDDHRGDPAKRRWQPEGFGPEGRSTGSRAQRFEDAYKVAQEEYKRKMECYST